MASKSFKTNVPSFPVPISDMLLPSCEVDSIFGNDEPGDNDDSEVGDDVVDEVVGDDVAIPPLGKVNDITLFNRKVLDVVGRRNSIVIRK